MKLHTYTLNDFSGGFAANTNEDSMKLSFTPDSYNVEVSGGSLKTVTGVSQYTNIPITSDGINFRPEKLMVYYSLGGKNGDELLVCASAYGCKGLFRFVNGVWVRYDENISDGNMGCVNYHFNNKNYLLICNSYDGIYKYCALPRTFEYIDDTPPLSSMTLHYERLWGVGDIDNPNTVYFSEYGNPSGWDSSSDAGSLTITTYDGDKFVGIANVFDDIILYRKKSIFRISGSTPANYQLVQVPSVAGAAGPKAFANNGRYSFFIAEDGIYSFDGLRTNVLENNRLRYFFENEVNKNCIENACAIIMNNKLFASVPTVASSHNNAIIEYDICEKIFNVRRNVEALDFAVYQDKLMFIDFSGNICILGEGASYSGKSILSHYETPFSDFENKNIVKTLDSVCFTAKGSGKIKIIAESENEISSATVQLRSSSQFDIYNVPLYCTGRRFKFAFENVNGSSFELVRPEFRLENDDED